MRLSDAMNAKYCRGRGGGAEPRRILFSVLPALLYIIRYNARTRRRKGEAPARSYRYFTDKRVADRVNRAAELGAVNGQRRGEDTLPNCYGKRRILYAEGCGGCGARIVCTTDAVHSHGVKLVPKLSPGLSKLPRVIREAERGARRTAERDARSARAPQPFGRPPHSIVIMLPYIHTSGVREPPQPESPRERSASTRSRDRPCLRIVVVEAALVRTFPPAPKKDTLKGNRGTERKGV